jgi:hypothetical protein
VASIPKNDIKINMASAPQSTDVPTTEPFRHSFDPEIAIQRTDLTKYRWRRMILSMISLLLALIVLCLSLGAYSEVPQYVQFPLIVAVLSMAYSLMSFVLYFFMKQNLKSLFLVDLLCAFMAFVGWLLAGLSLHEGIFFAEKTKSILAAAAIVAFFNLLPHLLLPLVYNPYCPGVFFFMVPLPF